MQLARRSGCALAPFPSHYNIERERERERRRLCFFNFFFFALLPLAVAADNTAPFFGRGLIFDFFFLPLRLGLGVKVYMCACMYVWERLCSAKSGPASQQERGLAIRTGSLWRRVLVFKAVRPNRSARCHCWAFRSCFGIYIHTYMYVCVCV